MINIERYDYAFDPDGDAWAARVLRRMPPRGTVLELGPGPGAMTRVLLARGYQVVVVENDPAALQALKALGVEAIEGDLDRADWLNSIAGRRFDVVLACDVLEHLRRPDQVLRSLEDCLQPTGNLILSIPNIAYAGVVAALRNGAFDYADKGQLDRTHVHFFTRRSIETMLLTCGWAPRAWEANRVPVESSEFAWCWNALPEAQKQSLREGWHDFDVYQWMAVATPAKDGLGWEMTAARANADKLRDEMQTLILEHQREHASLLEHQKAFAEAKDLIAKYQSEIRDMSAGVEALRLEKAALHAELMNHRASVPEKSWLARWRRSLRAFVPNDSC